VLCVTSLTFGAVVTTVRTRPDSASTPMWAFERVALVHYWRPARPSSVRRSLIAT
jgi:hypothetical protein